MERKVPISDASISRNVSRHLANAGLRAPCHIQVQTRKGEVTLSGSVQYVHQRNTAVQSIRTVEGVTRVVEKLKVTPPAKHQYTQAAAPPAQPPAVDKTVASPQQPISESRSEETNEPDSSPDATPPSASQPPADEASLVDLSYTLGDASRSAQKAPAAQGDDMHHTRSGDSYTFECASPDEAKRLRAVLADYTEWLKKHSWIGESKPSGDLHLVTFHSKSVIEFLRQQGF
jgi:type IV secretory pathway VirB10-like protein